MQFDRNCMPFGSINLKEMYMRQFTINIFLTDDYAVETVEVDKKALEDGDLDADDLITLASTDPECSIIYEVKDIPNE